MPERLRSPNIYTPKSMQELDQVMASHPDVLPFAGGTYIMSRPDYYPSTVHKDFLNLSIVPELFRIQYSDRFIEVGSMISINRLLTNGKSILSKPFLDQLSSIGNSIVRKKATIGGSLCTPDRRFTLSCLLSAMGAHAEIRITTGKYPASRWIPVSKLYDSAGRYLYQGKGILTRVRIPSYMESSYQNQLFYVLGSPMAFPDECVIAAMQYSISQEVISSPQLCFVFPSYGFYMRPETNSLFSTMRLPYDNTVSIKALSDAAIQQIQNVCPNVSSIQSERVKRLIQKALYMISTRYLGG